MNDRVQLRKELRKKRQDLGATAQQAAAAQLTQLLSQHPLFTTSQHIAAYIANDGEVDATALIQLAYQLGKSCYLPVVNDGSTLTFVAYQPGDHLAPNRFKIPEPKLEIAKIIAPAMIDLVLVPLVGFDLQGNRLGMGAGYYDRTFAFLKTQRSLSKARLVGLAYDFQKIAALAAESWDVPLTAVATEQQIYEFI